MSAHPLYPKSIYVLISFLKPIEICPDEVITLKLGRTAIRHLCAPGGIVNQVVTQLETHEQELNDWQVEAETDNRTIALSYQTRAISQVFANHLVREAIRPYISKDLHERLDSKTAWELYSRLLAGELSRPLRKQNSLKSLFWEQVCNYDTLHAAQAISYVGLYARLKSISFNEMKAIDASIVIPTYGQVHHTACCLLSVLEDRRKNFKKDGIKIEIIVVDDCFPDDKEREPLELWKSKGIIKLIRKERNSGFIETCNEGAKFAKGKFLIFLNNDTEVFDNWLQELMMPFADPSVGLTGSKLIYPDGSLQEAGGIIWANGNAWNYGRGAVNPYLPEFSYLRDTDYISGASIALRRDDFKRLDGFSSEFKPAYCEDSDLAFRVRKDLGKRVVFNPFSLVVHHEGKSCGTSLECGVKSYQVNNSKKLFKKWQATLENTHHEEGTDLFHARGRTANKKTVLIIDHYIPEPDRDAGSRTMTSFIEAILKIGCRAVFWPDNMYASPYLEHFQRMGVEVQYYTEQKRPDFQDWIEKNGRYIDIILVSRPNLMAKYANALKQHTQAPIIFYGHDLHHRRIQIEHSVKGIQKKKDRLQTLKDESYAWRESSIILYPTSEEVEIVRRHIYPKRNVQAIQAYAIGLEHANCQDAKTKTYERPFELLFVGGFRHSPNVDAMLWFCESIFPKISGVFDCHLTIAGSHPPNEIRAMSSNRIKVLGYVEDSVLDNLYASCDAAVVPLRYGAGIKGKVIEAFAKGIPVITTGIGMQGIDWPKRLSYEGNTAEEFAESTLQVLSDLKNNHCDATREIIDNARNFIAHNYSEDSMVEAWGRLLRQVSRAGNRRQHQALT